jgi:hypothetical protein
MDTPTEICPCAVTAVLNAKQTAASENFTF